ncbi:PLP-dependent transferase [Lecanosticta acicola]|uniref:PLP-dependent transferase n=1 Tax=Lecanosticta acicola TaxID=111012 RepID=A0AAI8YS85_9PEZI|nr:PLP-dependent transferase [Lecanosticta acicola]
MPEDTSILIDMKNLDLTADMVIRPNKSKLEIDAIDSIQCGKEVARHFGFAEGYRNLNHGSFGTYPAGVKAVQRKFQDDCEARPDQFIRYEFPRRNDEARGAVAGILGVDSETCVFVPNATTGVNTVLRNIVYQPGDVIIYFATIYGACHKTVEYMTETTPAESRSVEYKYPISDAELCSRFEETIKAIKTQGKNPKLAIFDSIVSLPGVRAPFEELTKICREYNTLSCIDGAHGIGHIPLNLKEVDPDFFVSNCHKWLYVPRGCAVFYVPVRNQHLIRSSLPTSHGFVPRETEAAFNPLPPSQKSEFVNQFEFVGTLDNSPYLCIPTALQWREKVRYGELKGEEAVMKYCVDVARQGGDKTAQILGTEVLENAEGTLRNCAFANVRLPLSYSDLAGGDMNTAISIAQWMSKTLLDEYNTFLALLIHAENFYVRLSGQIYLTEEDFDWAGNVLKEVCARAKKGEWKEGERA